LCNGFHELREIRKQGMNFVAQFQTHAPKWMGALSIVSGFALVAAPRAMSRIFGLPEITRLCRALGARDVAIGLGLLRFGHSHLGWSIGRTVSDVVDVALIFRNLLSAERRHNGDRVRMVGGVLLVGVDLLTTLAAARHLDPERRERCCDAPDGAISLQ
jgi:hypothetical protein